MTPSQHRGKRPRQVDASSSNPNAQTQSVPSLPPWPRREGSKIAISRVWDDVPEVILARKEVTDREIREMWDDYDSLLYNEWLSVKLGGTRIANTRALSGLGLKDEVRRLLGNAGLGTIATKYYPMYPDLVKQFFASVRVYCEAVVGSIDRGNSGSWFLSFIIRGIRYRVSIRDLCGIYGFDPDVEAKGLPETFPDIQGFWALFGTGAYRTRGSTQTDVRHPVLRYVLRLISDTILYKTEPGKMRLQELVLLAHALREDLPDLSILALPVNMGIVFAEHLVTLKNTPLSLKSGKFFRAGSLLTPIFQHCGIDTPICTVDSIVCAMDLGYMQRATWIKMESLKVYHWVFSPTPGVQRMVKLPLLELMCISTNPAVLSFEPHPSLLQTVGTIRKQFTRGSETSSTRAGLSGTGTSGASPELPQLPPSPQLPMEIEDFQRYVVKSFRALYNAISTLSRCGCVRP